MGAGLHDHADHLTLISCSQTAHLNDLTGYVHGADRDRLFKTMAQLKSLNVAQARALARQRLDAVPELAELRKRHKSLLWPLHEKDLETLIPKEGCPARLLITHCRDLYERASGGAAPLAETTGPFLERIWTERCEKQLHDDTVSDTGGILHTALPQAVRLSGTAWRPAEPPMHDMELGFASPSFFGGGAGLAISLCNHGNMMSLAGRLRRLKDAT